MKKEYVKPQMEVVNCSSRTKLLSGSGDDPYLEESDDNPYWEGPGETPSGCKSNWWC